MSQNIKKLGAMGVVALTLGGALLATACGAGPETAAAGESTAAQTQQSETAAAGTWVQVWGDEFNGTSLDMSNWSYETNIHVNNEQEQYTNSERNVKVSDGTLKLTVRREATNGYPFSSGRINSKDKREFMHSRVEARIKMPVGEGLWPAFWMLGANIDTAPWPNCGEIDIMENVGYATWTSGALHGPGYFGNTPITGRFNPDSSVKQFHVYRADYSPTDVKWYIDGTLVKTATKAEITKYGNYVFDHPFYILFNLAIGGEYPHGLNGANSPFYGVPQSTATLVSNEPQTMEVDWVHVYQQQ